MGKETRPWMCFLFIAIKRLTECWKSPADHE